MADQGAGLRGLVGAGRSRVSLSAAARVRDRGRPSAADLAAAEAEIDRRLADRPAIARATAGRSPTAGGIRAPEPGAGATPAVPTSATPASATPTPGDVGPRRGRENGRPSRTRT